MAKKETLPSAGEFDTRQKEKSLPSVSELTLSKGGSFAECLEFDTRQSVEALPSVWDLALGKGCTFAEYLGVDTRQRSRDRLRVVVLLFFAERRFQLSAKCLPSVR